MDYPRFPISEVHLEKFRDSLDFQSWKVNFNTEVCKFSVCSNPYAQDPRS